MAQKSGKRPSTAAVCEELARPVAERMGVYLWDVVFEKEGAGWYLRYFIDRDPDGIDIDSCEAFSREMSDLLDAADPIEQSYTLEVGSPGVERRLTKDWHFEKYIGEPVVVRLFRPQDGLREFLGTLVSHDRERGVEIEEDGGERLLFAPETVAQVRLYVEF